MLFQPDVIYTTWRCIKFGKVEKCTYQLQENSLTHQNLLSGNIQNCVPFPRSNRRFSLRSFRNAQFKRNDNTTKLYLKCLYSVKITYQVNKIPDSIKFQIKINPSILYICVSRSITPRLCVRLCARTRIFMCAYMRAYVHVRYLFNDDTLVLRFLLLWDSLWSH